jgi:hypothetical protein
MAVSKPVGDNARKGAVRKRTQLKNPLTKPREKGRAIRDRQEVPEKVQGRPAREVLPRYQFDLVDSKTVADEVAAGA